jgi:hypothetical protein
MTSLPRPKSNSEASQHDALAHAHRGPRHRNRASAIHRQSGENCDQREKAHAARILFFREREFFDGHGARRAASKPSASRTNARITQHPVAAKRGPLLRSASDGVIRIHASYDSEGSRLRSDV